MSVLPVVWEDKGIERIYSEISEENGIYKLIDVEITDEDLTAAKETNQK